MKRGEGEPDTHKMFAPLPRIERAIEEYLEKAEGGDALGRAMRYAVLNGGKRLRPLLAWHSSVACGGTGEDSLCAGIAVELVHAFSLVHDDLPALDNDDVRRGQPTLHKHAGEAMAILAGDQLLVEAFACVAGQVGWEDGNRKLELVRILTSATLAMVRGQVFDTLGGLPEQSSPLESLRLVHSCKTGALIEASCRMGAVCAAGAVAEDKQAAIRAYGGRVGLMFQVVDDLIDVTQPESHAGKRTGKDAVAGKLTYPGVLGVEGSQAEVASLLEQAVSAVRYLGVGAENLIQLAEYLANRTK